MGFSRLERGGLRDLEVVVHLGDLKVQLFTLLVNACALRLGSLAGSSKLQGGGGLGPKEGPRRLRALWALPLVCSSSDPRGCHRGGGGGAKGSLSACSRRLSAGSRGELCSDAYVAPELNILLEPLTASGLCCVKER